jgi:hypothetical protein
MLLVSTTLQVRRARLPPSLQFALANIDGLWKLAYQLMRTESGEKWSKPAGHVVAAVDIVGG